MGLAGARNRDNLVQDSPKPVRSELIVHPQSLKSAATVLYLEPLNSTGPAEESRALPFEAWRVIRNSLPWLIAIVLVGSLGGFMLSLWETPTYTAKVSLEIQTPTDITANLQVGDGAAIAPESYLPTQMTILDSRTLHKRAFARLRKNNFQSDNPPARRLAPWHSLFGDAPKPSPDAPEKFAPIVVTVSNTVNTRIVAIACDSPDPKLAAAYANALANEYIDSNLQSRWDAINNARQWLAQQLEDTRTKLQKSEDDLQSYGRSQNLIFTDGKESAEQDKLKEIQTSVADAQADRIAKQSAYQTALSAPPDSVPQVLDNAQMIAYQAQLADLRRQLADLSSQYTSEHPKVQRVQAQIDQVQAAFQKERGNIMQRIQNDYETSRMRESMLRSSYDKQVQMVSDQTQKTTSYNIMERDVQTNQQMYDTLLQKAREADIATALRGSNARIIDPAETPNSPSKPNFTWNTLLGTLSGLVLGLGLIVLRESLDRSFRAPGDASFHLKLPELGVIPAGNALVMNTGAKTPLAANPSASSARPGREAGAVELVTWRDKSSVIAESFRSAVTSILHSEENGVAPRVILVSSAIRGEGKTTIVSNLGIALAEINQRVLLIDGDMRKPRLNTVFNVPNDWGLSDLLREKSSLRDCPLEALVKPTEMPELSVLTSGPGTNSISNLLYSHRMLELLQRLRCEFDHVLIDTPPMLDIADARILGRLADAAILVFRAGKTSREAAFAAKRRLTDDGIPVLGTILNAWDVKSMGGYGYGAYEYYSSTP
jgi:succinoglycan biosynthesis transport protein ExoP